MPDEDPDEYFVVPVNGYRCGVSQTDNGLRLVALQFHQQHNDSPLFLMPPEMARALAAALAANADDIQTLQ